MTEMDDEIGVYVLCCHLVYAAAPVAGICEDEEVGHGAGRAGCRVGAGGGRRGSIADEGADLVPQSPVHGDRIYERLVGELQGDALEATGVDLGGGGDDVVDVVDGAAGRGSGGGLGERIELEGSGEDGLVCSAECRHGSVGCSRWWCSGSIRSRSAWLFRNFFFASHSQGSGRGRNSLVPNWGYSGVRSSLNVLDGRIPWARNSEVPLCGGSGRDEQTARCLSLDGGPSERMTSASRKGADTFPQPPSR